MGTLQSIIPTELVNIGPEKRNYDIINFPWGSEVSYITGHTMFEEWKIKTDASVGEDDGQYLLDNQRDIPIVLRGKVAFVFTDWCLSDSPESVFYCVYWVGNCWVPYWDWFGLDWRSGGRVLRRKK